MKSIKSNLAKLVVCLTLFAMSIPLAAGITLMMSEYAHAAETAAVYQFVGKPACTVLESYGNPKEWAFLSSETDDEGEAVWYFDDVAFYVTYNANNPEGIIAHAETVR